MLRRLLEAVSIDYDQWRALTRAALRVDFRVAGMGSLINQNRRRGYMSLVSLLVFYLVTGVFFAALILFNKDVFFTGTVFLTYTMFMIGALVLVEYHSIVISPDDYAILGYQPISSRTYFAAKLTNALFYTSLLTTALGILPIAAYTFTLGFRPLLGGAAAVATYLATSTITLAMILLYAAVVRLVHPRKLSRALSYLQLVLSFVIYGGYVIIPELVDRSTIASMSFTKTPWLLLHPATWFASYLDLAIGNVGLAVLVPGLCSLAAIALLIRFAGGNLSLDYSERLSVLTSTSQGSQPARLSPLRSIFFRKNEGRAVALLIRSQFKYDQKFRLAVLGILPLTVFYLILGLREGPLPDPFVDPQLELGRAGLLYLAILLFPVMLKTTLANSDSYQASWIFYASPARKERLVLAMKDFVMVYFLIPYLVFIGAIFVYFFHNLIHVALHVVVLTLLAHIVLQLAVLLHPDLPFSQPVRKGERSGRIVLIILIGPMMGMVVLPVLFHWAYPRPISLAAVLAGLTLITVLLGRAVRSRVRRVTGELEFQG